jgi:hypothetical protein
MAVISSVVRMLSGGCRAAVPKAREQGRRRVGGKQWRRKAGNSGWGEHMETAAESRWLRRWESGGDGGCGGTGPGAPAPGGMEKKGGARRAPAPVGIHTR